MTLTADMVTVLRTVCPKVHAGFAPDARATDYLIWRRTGGKATAYVEGGLADLRNATVRIEAWSRTAPGADALITAVEAALVAWNGTPVADVTTDEDEELGLYGAIQDFSIWAAR